MTTDHGPPHHPSSTPPHPTLFPPSYSHHPIPNNAAAADNADDDAQPTHPSPLFPTIPDPTGRTPPSRPVGHEERRWFGLYVGFLRPGLAIARERRES